MHWNRRSFDSDIQNQDGKGCHNAVSYVVLNERRVVVAIVWRGRRHGLLQVFQELLLIKVPWKRTTIGLVVDYGLKTVKDSSCMGILANE